jgi:hypothetical protein
MMGVIKSYRHVMLHAWGRKKYRILFGNLEGRGQNTCNYPTVLKEKNTEKQKVYNLRYLLAKVRTT